MKESNNFIEKISSKTWHFTYDRKMSYQRIRLFHYGYCNQLSKFFNVKIDSEIYRIKDENVSVYYELNDHTKAFEDVRSTFARKDGVNLVKKIKSTIQTYYKEFIRDINKKPRDYSKFSNTNLVAAFKNFSRQNEKISLPTWLLYLYVEEILTDEVRSQLEIKIQDKSKVENVLSLIANPTKILPLDAYHKDLYKLVLLPKYQYKKTLEKLSKKYASWGVYDVNFDLPDLAVHENKIKNLDKITARKKIKEIDEKYKNQINNLDKIKKLWVKDKTLSAFTDLYSLYANFKDWKNYYREQSSYKMKIMLDEIAKRLSLTSKQVYFLTEEDTILALENKINIDGNEIDKRIKNSALVFLCNEMFLVTDPIVLKEIDNRIEVKSVVSIKGSIAYSGIVRGHAKIISSTKDFDKVNEGDILVASTTRPDYLPFMKKSGGFVTNEGGMLSHAAIMARELKKPCIIGTKIATKVLKDGDLVEVDAEKGVVTIIKRA